MSKPISYNAMMSSRRLDEFDEVEKRRQLCAPPEGIITINKAHIIPRGSPFEKGVSGNHGQSQTPEEIGRTGGTKMTEQTTEISWDDALAGSGKFVKLEEGKRVVLVGKNSRFSSVEKEFQGQEKAMYNQLTLDVVEEADTECEKVIETISKRFIKGLRPLFEGIPSEQEVRFSVKKIGEGTDTNYDVEAVVVEN